MSTGGPFGSFLWGGSGGGSTPVPSIAASEIVYSAYRKIAVLAAAKRGYSPSQGADGLNILNRMLDSWNTEKLIVWNELRIVRDFVVGQQDYQIGPGAADFPDLDRPLNIDRASIIQNPASNLPIELQIAIWTYQQWQTVMVKNLPTPLPQGVYYETSVPYGVLHFWPVPSGPVQMVLYVGQQLTQVASLDTYLILPPGYARALIFNLAVELSDDFPRGRLTANTVAIATESKAWIKRRNIRPLDIQCDPAVVRTDGVMGWNNYTGTWNWPR